MLDPKIRWSIIIPSPQNDWLKKVSPILRQTFSRSPSSLLESGHLTTKPQHQTKAGQRQGQKFGSLGGTYQLGTEHFPGAEDFQMGEWDLLIYRYPEQNICLMI